MPSWTQIELRLNFETPTSTQYLCTFQKCILWITFARGKVIDIWDLQGWRADREESDSALRNTFYFSFETRTFARTYTLVPVCARCSFCGLAWPGCWPRLALVCAGWYFDSARGGWKFSMKRQKQPRGNKHNCFLVVRDSLNQRISRLRTAEKQVAGRGQSKWLITTILLGTAVYCKINVRTLLWTVADTCSLSYKPYFLRWSWQVLPVCYPTGLPA